MRDGRVTLRQFTHEASHRKTSTMSAVTVIVSLQTTTEKPIKNRRVLRSKASREFQGLFTAEKLAANLTAEISAANLLLKSQESFHE